MDESLHGYRRLKSGPLTLLYGQGEVRRISVGQVQVVSAIYAAVRDQNWGTVPFRITRETVEEQKHGFAIHLDLEYRESGIRYAARMDIEARDQSLEVRYRGLALGAFRRNRIGLCILHPIKDCRGKAVQVLHPGGSTSRGVFPERISPHQPFLNISGMSWEPAPGISATLAFQGEVFETEDQRNWTDASYKTYGTPLAKPFPVRVDKGDEVDQRMTLQVAVNKEKVKATGSCPRIVRIQPREGFPLPPLGTMRSREEKPLGKEEAEQLRRLPFRHYRVDLELGKRTWERIYERVSEEQPLLGWPLELALHFGDYPLDELQPFLQKHREKPLKIIRFLVFDASFLSGSTLLQLVVPALTEAFPGIPVGGGTDAHFAELNRNRTETGLLDFISFSICPQVHAFDKLTLLENLEAQSQVVESARQLFRKPVSIGAISLKQRFNAVATDGDKERSAPEADPRQHSFFNAGWTLGSLRQLASACAASLTYYETVGPRGILPRKGDPTGPSPLLHLFQELNGADPPEVLPTESSHPLEIEALCLKFAKETKLLLANHGRSGIPIRVEGMKTEAQGLFILGDKGWEEGDVKEVADHHITLKSNNLYKIMYAQ